MDIEVDDDALDWGGPCRYRATKDGFTGPWCFSKENAKKTLDSILRMRYDEGFDSFLEKMGVSRQYVTSRN